MKHINLVLLLNDMRYINAVFLRGVGIDKPLIASCGSSKNGKGERGALNFLPPLSPLPKKSRLHFIIPLMLREKKTICTFKDLKYSQ